MRTLQAVLTVTAKNSFYLLHLQRPLVFNMDSIFSRNLVQARCLSKRG